MNEAGQSKRLIVLDHHYQQIEEMHLDIGPRHFYIEGAQQAMPQGLRAGDRFVTYSCEPGCVQDWEHVIMQWQHSCVCLDLLRSAVRTWYCIPLSDV